MYYISVLKPYYSEVRENVRTERQERKQWQIKFGKDQLQK